MINDALNTESNQEQTEQQIEHDVRALGEEASSMIPMLDTPSVANPMSAVEAQTCTFCGAELNTGMNLTEQAGFVYALGRIEPRFPSVSLEKEMAQALGRTETEGLTDPQAFLAVLSERQNRYLARQLCWILMVEGLETYLLLPRDLADLDMFIESIRPAPSPADTDIVIGVRGPIAPPEMCSGLMIPIVVFDQIYSFDADTLIKSIPHPESIEADQFEPAALELFNRIMQMADNAGSTDEHRAMNYLAVRYPAIYATTVEAFGRDSSLTSVESRPSRLSGVRKILDVVFTYTNRKTDVNEKYFVRVDVSDEFPFLVTKLQPFYDR